MRRTLKREDVAETVTVMRERIDLSKLALAQRMTGIAGPGRSSQSACRTRIQELEAGGGDRLNLRDLAEIVYALDGRVEEVLGTGPRRGRGHGHREPTRPPPDIDVLEREVRGRLRQQRIGKGWGVKRTARAARVDTAWLTRVERGVKQRVDLVRIARVCTVLDLDLVEDIVGPAERAAEHAVAA